MFIKNLLHQGKEVINVFNKDTQINVPNQPKSWLHHQLNTTHIRGHLKLTRLNNIIFWKIINV